MDESIEITKGYQWVLLEHVLKPLPGHVYLIANPCLYLIFAYGNDVLIENHYEYF